MKIRLILLFFLIFTACTNQQASEKDSGQKNLKEPLINANKVIAADNAREIELYVNRHHLSMTETGSGLRYVIIKAGNGKKVLSGNRLQIKFRSSLLNDMTCYKGEKEFIAGHSDMESGVEEGVLQLHEGDSARLIIPPHLAYGISGDNHRVPSNAVLVYDIRVKKIFN